MTDLIRPLRPSVGALALTLGSLTIVGCGPDADGLHPVVGRFVVEGGDISTLAGHTVETRLESDPLIRSSAQIGDDGSFRLETLRGGEILAGAAEGRHIVRLVLSDDDREKLARDSKRIGPEFREFQRSELRLDSPASGEPELPVRLK